MSNFGENDLGLEDKYMEVRLRQGRFMTAECMRQIFQSPTARIEYVLPNLSVPPFDNNPSSADKFKAATILAAYRDKDGNPTPASTNSYIVGEMFGFVLPVHMVMSRTRANVYFVDAMRWYTRKHNQRADWLTYTKGGTDDDSITEPHPWFINNDTVPSDKYVDMMADMSFAFKDYMTLGLDVRETQQRFSLLATMVVTMVKAGSCTDRYIARINNDLNRECNLNLNIDRSTINAIWSSYGSYVDAFSAKRVFDLLREYIPIEMSMRIWVILGQAPWRGLTAYVLVNHAMKQCASFPWNHLKMIVPSDFVNYSAAVAQVGDNEWAGYSPSMCDKAQSTKYKGLAYASRRLIKDVVGEHTYDYYQGIMFNVPRVAAIDKLIEAYKLVYASQHHFTAILPHTDETSQFCDSLPPI